jgi:hypothetical protein
MSEATPVDQSRRGAVRKVPVAEDEPFIALDLEEILRGAGHAVLGPCASVAEAMGLEAILTSAGHAVLGPCASVAEAMGLEAILTSAGHAVLGPCATVAEALAALAAAGPTRRCSTSAPRTAPRRPWPRRWPSRAFPSSRSPATATTRWTAAPATPARPA